MLLHRWLETLAKMRSQPAVYLDGRVMTFDDLAQALTDLAAKTYVPDTAASRLGGAGAGLTDND